VGVSSLNRRASPCAFDCALSGLTLCQYLNDKSSKGATSEAQGEALCKNDALETVKSNSSKWIKGLDKRLNNFYWQNGYGAFSVDPRRIDKVKEYIQNQIEHHRVKTFQEEFLIILKD